VFVNIFECFRKTNDEILEALNYAYPDHKLNTVAGSAALNQIEGLAKSLKIVMQAKYDNVESAEKEEKFRSIYSKFEATDQQEDAKNEEEELGYVMNWDSIFEAYPNSIIKNIDFYKKTGDNAMHGVLQSITGKVEVMNLFLKAIKTSGA